MSKILLLVVVGALFGFAAVIFWVRFVGRLRHGRWDIRVSGVLAFLGYVMVITGLLADWDVFLNMGLAIAAVGAVYVLVGMNRVQRTNRSAVGNNADRYGDS